VTPPRATPWAHRLYALLLRLLVPAWLRDRAGDEMRATLAARLDAARSSREWWRELARELGGLAYVAVAARAASARRSHAPARRVHHPADRRWSMLDVIRQDLAFAARSMRRRRGVALLAILTLALGVGASTAMFSVVDSVLLRPLPFEEPERIVMVNPTIEEWKDHPSLHDSWRDGRFSPPELHDWLARQRSFEAAGGYTATSARVPSGDGSERIPIAAATAGLWKALRVQPLLGRLPTDDEPEQVAVLSHRFWRTRMGGDPAAVGRDILLNDRPVRVIGVLPPEFALVGVEAEVWQRIVVTGTNDNLTNHFLEAVGRLREGVTVAQAEQETTRLLRATSGGDAGHVTHGAFVVSPVQQATEEIRVPLLVLAAASLLLLLAACANVALLLLGAGAERVRELAVRQALGARKARVALQLLVESLVLGIAGAAAGVLVAAGAVRALVAIMPEGVPRVGDVGVDLRTFGVAGLLAVATGVLVGCFPAFSLSRGDAAEALRAGATTLARGRLQRAVVVVELALATVLLVGAGLLTRTMSELQQVRPGFDTERLLTMQLSLPYDRFFRPGVHPDSAAAELRAYTERLVEAVRTVPGAEGLALSSDMPYSGDRGTNPIEPEGFQPAPGEVIDAARRFVSGNYFDVMRIPVLQGRPLAPADDQPGAERVMVVTDRLARHFWPDGRWLDRTVGFWGERYRVVGVIADTREHDLRGDEDRFKFYVPGSASGNLGDNLLIRTTTAAELLLPMLRERVWRVDRAIVITDAVPMEERIAHSLAAERYRMRLMLAFSVMAAGFSLLGIYGVMSQAVARRRRELGLRMALGAQRERILSLVLGEAARIGTVGAALGVAGALVATRVLESLIWGVPRLDPLTYGGAAAVLLGLTIVAALAPAHRASTVEPMGVLRS
jgi:putative ABC transport system permease protein